MAQLRNWQQLGRRHGKHRRKTRLCDTSCLAELDRTAGWMGQAPGWMPQENAQQVSGVSLSRDSVRYSQQANVLSRAATLWDATEAVALGGSAIAAVAAIVLDSAAFAAPPALLPLLALLASKRSAAARQRLYSLRYEDVCMQLLEVAQKAADESRLSHLAEQVAKPQAEAAAREVSNALRPAAELTARFKSVEDALTQLTNQSEEAAREAGQAVGRVASQSDASREAAEASLNAVQALSDVPERLQELEDAVSALEEGQNRLRPGIQEAVREEVRAPLAAVPQLMAALGDRQSQPPQQQSADAIQGVERLETMVYSAAGDAVSEALSASAVSELGGLAERVSSINAKLEEQRATIDSLQKSVVHDIRPALSEVQVRVLNDFSSASDDAAVVPQVGMKDAGNEHQEHHETDQRGSNGHEEISSPTSTPAHNESLRMPSNGAHAQDEDERTAQRRIHADEASNVAAVDDRNQMMKQRGERSASEQTNASIDYDQLMSRSLSLLKEGRVAANNEEAWDLLQQAADGFEQLVSREETRTTAALGNLGNTLAALARVVWLEGTDEGASEAEELLVDAGRCFRAVLRKSASDARAASNWGFALSFRAQIASAYEKRSDAARLYEAALEKFAAADDATGGTTYATLVAEGDCLSELAMLKTQRQQQEDTLARAKRRYERAVRLEPESDDAIEGLDACKRALFALRQPRGREVHGAPLR